MCKFTQKLHTTPLRKQNFSSLWHNFRIFNYCCPIKAEQKKSGQAFVFLLQFNTPLCCMVIIIKFTFLEEKVKGCEIHFAALSGLEKFSKTI